MRDQYSFFQKNKIIKKKGGGNMKDLTNISTEPADKIVKQYLEFRAAQEDIEAGMSVIRDELLSRLQAMKVTGMRFGDSYVSQVKRISTAGVTLAQARELSCTSIKVDGEKIRKLYAKGVAIKGIHVTNSIRITEAKDK